MPPSPCGIYHGYFLIAYYGDAHYVSPGWNSVLYYSFALPELVLLLYNFIFTSFALNIVRKSAVFHKNLIAIAMFLFVHGYVHMTMRSVLILYQNNIISLDEANTNNIAHLIAFIASMLRNYQTLAIMQLFPITIIERLLATIFISNYEKRGRRYISISLLTIDVIISLVFGFNRVLELFEVPTTVTFVLLFPVGILPAVIAVTLLLINKRRFNRILLKYDLSTKYQLTENLRAFRFIEIIIVWGIIGTTSSNLILLYGATDRANCQFVSLCGAAYEIQSTLSYTLGVSACFLTQTEWRLQLMEKMKKIIRRLRHLFFTVLLGFESDSSVSTTTTSKAQTARLPPSLKTARKPEDEARIYFNDLARAWDAKFSVCDRNGTCFGIAFYGNEANLLPGISSVLYHLFTTIDFVLMAYNNILVALVINIVRKSSVFHPNMTNLALLFLSHVYIHTITRTILFLYQRKLILIYEHNHTALPNIVAYVTSVFRIYQGFSVPLLFPTVIVERLMATIFLTDYEKKRRGYISICLLGFIIGASFAGALSKEFDIVRLNLPLSIFLCFWLVVVPASIAITIVVVNRKRWSTILLSVKYTLSVKYQLEENRRAFKFLEFILFWGVVGISASGAVLLIADIFKKDGNIVCICGAAYEMFAMISFAGGASTIILTQPPWRAALRAKLEKFQRRILLRPKSDAPAAPVPQLPKSLRRSMTSADETRLYFNDLSRVWSTQLNPQFVETTL